MNNRPIFHSSINGCSHVLLICASFNNEYYSCNYSQPCPIVITDTDNTPPVDNYTVNIMGLLSVDITTDTCDYTIPVDEGNIYTVEMSVNNIIGSTKTTADPFSKFINSR